MEMNDNHDNGNDMNEESTPLDDIISNVDSYIKNPKLVTSETLTKLKSDLEDLKSFLDSEEPIEEEDSGMDMSKDNDSRHGIGVMISVMRKKGGGR